MGIPQGMKPRIPSWATSGKEMTEDEQVTGDPHTLLFQTFRLGCTNDMIQTGPTGGPE